jgi:hypothetical protein
VLLILLLSIHSVKLLHNHSYKQITDTQCRHSTDNNKHTPESVSHVPGDCDICNYQPAKDSDNLICTIAIHFSPTPAIFNASLISFKELRSFTSFETRGPPAIML